MAGSGASDGNTDAELRLIIAEIEALLHTIDQSTPLIQLAISASGESLSTHMPQGISPSRFLQASALLTFGDTQFAHDLGRPVQIGPSFTLSLYMLFLGHASETFGHGKLSGSGPAAQARSSNHIKSPQHGEPYGLGEGERKPIWQEVLHKARVRLCRIPRNWVFGKQHGYRPKVPDAHLNSVALAGMSALSYGRLNQFGYCLEIVEDFNDGRAHPEDGPKTAPFDDIERAGVRESIPIHQISKIFYADTGRILNIGSDNDFENNQVLLLKRDPTASLRAMKHLDPGESQDEDEDEDQEEDQDEDKDEDKNETVDECSSESTISGDQADIDRQLREESAAVADLPATDSQDGTGPDSSRRDWNLPPHLDPEWIALEIFVEDDDDETGLEDVEDSDVAENHLTEEDSPVRPAKTRNAQRSSLDSRLISQIRSLSVRPSLDPVSCNGADDVPPSSDIGHDSFESPESFVARSPFGNITSSLSLMEMLIRLTSLQEVQQTSHLAIPDHILNFFLEDASTTGLRGEEQWKVRNAAKRRVGFDPYTDTPTK